MCNFFSAIMTKKNILWDSKIDHHTTILENNNIEDKNHSPKFVRVEYIPNTTPPTNNPSDWTFNVDQDFKPDWWDSEIDKERFIKFFWKNIFDSIIMFGEEIDLLENKHLRYLINSKIEVVKNATIQNIYNSSIQQMQGNSTVNYMRNSSTVNVMWDNSTVNSMWDNSTVNDMGGNSTVNSMWDNSTVNSMWGNNTVNDMGGNSCVKSSKEGLFLLALLSNGSNKVKRVSKVK